VHSFPHNIEHCLQWAREIIFEGRFVADADVVNKFLTKADYVATYVALPLFVVPFILVLFFVYVCFSCYWYFLTLV
jgi:hypothetical protein